MLQVVIHNQATSCVATKRTVPEFAVYVYGYMMHMGSGVEACGSAR